MRIVMPTLLGMEALVANEMEKQGYSREQITVKDGQVFLDVGAEKRDLSLAVARLNIWSACGERVELEVLEQEVKTFDELFEVVKAYPWEKIIPLRSPFVIAGGYSRQSQIFGIPSCQAIIRKAMITRLLQAYHLPADSFWEEDSKQEALKLQFSFMKDVFSLRIDTTGVGLHKRGYRIEANLAPLKETLAAAFVQLVHYQPFADEALWDPFCGSGTLLIEAARQAAGIAPGLKRNFAAEKFSFLDTFVFDQVRVEAEAEIDLTAPDEVFLFGSDIDPEAVAIAKANAERAGVADFIHFEVADVTELSTERMKAVTKHSFLTILCNPPYGERLLSEEEAHQLLKQLKPLFFVSTGLKPGVRVHVYSADPYVEEALGFAADKRRKLYNGMIPCQFYQYFKKEGLPVSPKARAVFTRKSTEKLTPTIKVGDLESREEGFAFRERRGYRGSYEERGAGRSPRRLGDAKPRFGEERGGQGYRGSHEERGAGRGPRRLGDGKPRFGEERGGRGYRGSYEERGAGRSPRRLGDGKPRFGEERGGRGYRGSYEERGAGRGPRRFGDGKPRFSKERGSRSSTEDGGRRFTSSRPKFNKDTDGRSRFNN